MELLDKQCKQLYRKEKKIMGYQGGGDWSQWGYTETTLKRYVIELEANQKFETNRTNGRPEDSFREGARLEWYEYSFTNWKTITLTVWPSIGTVLSRVDETSNWGAGISRWRWLISVRVYRLISLDRKARDKALDSLTKFVQSRTDLTLVDLLKQESRALSRAFRSKEIS
jgi:hypothetical protein